MDPTNRVIKLCIDGTQAEYRKQPAEARTCYEQAWAAASDDYEACIAAHYMARFQSDADIELGWNQEALRRADAVGDERVAALYPSLYVNLGHSYERLGVMALATEYYQKAEALGLKHAE